MSIRRIWLSWLFLSEPKSTHGVHLCLSNSCCAPQRMSCARQREFLNQKREMKKGGGNWEWGKNPSEYVCCSEVQWWFNIFSEYTSFLEKKKTLANLFLSLIKQNQIRAHPIWRKPGALYRKIEHWSIFEMQERRLI